MKKEFDIWNKQKKNINYYKERKKYHAGDVWWMHTGLNIGFEQDGKHKNFERPALVIKGFNKEVCLIVPLTTKYRDTKFCLYVGEFDNQKNYAILSQIRLVDVKRLINQIGFVDSLKLTEIKKAIWSLIR